VKVVDGGWPAKISVHICHSHPTICYQRLDSDSSMKGIVTAGLCMCEEEKRGAGRVEIPVYALSSA
jgi:hypothetical protein